MIYIGTSFYASVIDDKIFPSKRVSYIIKTSFACGAGSMLGLSMGYVILTIWGLL